MDEKIEMLQKIIDESSYIVFFGGAGVSTESGVPDFRSMNGLYNLEWNYPPETIVSHSFFYNEPKEFYRFYREKFIIDGIKPNKAHYKLAEMEAAGKLKAIITQNIDGLHQLAGSKNVYELHGSTQRNFCTKCGKFFSSDFILKSENAPDSLPHCDECNSIVKPDVVLYEEELKKSDIDGSIDEICKADTLIIGGTSLVVNPAASFVRYFRGKHLVIINKTCTDMDKNCELVIREPIGEVLDQIKVR